jgi:Raf kinase inhibitor-like YbhB/YbcL family protein
MPNVRARNSALAIAVLIALAGCSSSSKQSSPTTTAAAAGSMQLSSVSFPDNGPIATEFTCAGANKITPLEWAGVPVGTTSLALVVHDPDAPVPGGFTHWIVTGLHPVDGSLPPIPAGAEQWRNSAGNAAWAGPCPPPGKPHHYQFTLYALHGPVRQGATPAESITNIKDQAIGQATLTGTYQR